MSPPARGPLRIRSGRSELALHAPGGGRAEGAPVLLLVHELGGRAADLAGWAAAWPGRAAALDLAGHGESDRHRGGAYSPELFAADVDAAMAALAGGAAPVCLAGAGLGAYVALLVAGARPQRVRAAWLAPGRGLEGGGPEPDFARPAQEVTAAHLAWLREAEAAEAGGTAFDPMVRACESDARPPAYARAFADAARRLLLAEDGSPRPPWWTALRDAPAAEPAPTDPAAALARLARAAAGGLRGA